jgi:hypothetical protein
LRADRRRIRGVRTAAMVLACLLAAGCSDDGEQQVSSSAGGVAKRDFRLVESPPAVRSQCVMTAKRLGYSVPCPGLLPTYSDPTPVHDPALTDLPFVDDYVRPGFRGYRKWMFLTVDFPTAVREGHLVISASPHPVDALHFMSLRPSPYDRIERAAEIRLRGHRAEVVRVLVSDGSIFQRHTLLLWTEGGHTYGVGFHGLDKEAARLDLQVARSIRLFRP